MHPDLRPCVGEGAEHPGHEAASRRVAGTGADATGARFEGTDATSVDASKARLRSAFSSTPASRR
ncbi:pentapeptide repeat-containing protein [Microbacterium phyllosphaerae]